jgi:hypothetical protein
VTDATTMNRIYHLLGGVALTNNEADEIIELVRSRTVGSLPEAVAEVATLEAGAMETFREVALRHAVTTRGDLVSAEKVVEAAQVYLAFLEAE